MKTFYGYGYEADELEKAFDIVELALREKAITKIQLEYSEGVEVTGRHYSSSRASLYKAWCGNNKK